MRTFSRQTFRADFKDHKPHLNARLVELLTSGIGFRQTARLLPLSPRCTELKFRKLARHVGDLDRNLRRPLGLGGDNDALRIHLDEFETYEARRNTRPVSIAVLIESTSRFLIAARAAPIRARGSMTLSRTAAIESETRRWGLRPDRSRAATRKALKEAARLAARSSCIILNTDEKSTYPSLAERALAGRLLVHRRTPSKQLRTVGNPLFPINHTEACMRDRISRLRRESWLVSKARWFLNRHLSLYAAWRNWVRPRFNKDTASPGQLLGLVPRRLRVGELLGWRQDWGLSSPHPIGNGRRAVAS